jgi:glycine dehydrogenase subunit 1
MRYLPTAPDDERAMLEVIGAKSIDDLFSSIPREIRFKGRLEIEPARSEQELHGFFSELAEKNQAARMDCFLGGGMYRHFVPSHVDQLILRSEFYTAYTPYQPELAQGTLQTIFEFQSMIAMLTGMEVANASLYDGATACSEALLMADRIARKRKKMLICGAVHPHYREVCDTFLRHLGIEVLTVPMLPDGSSCLEEARKLIDAETAGVLVQSPNFLGAVEDVAAWAELAHGAGAMLVTAVTEPLSLGILRPPGELGADVVCGEGQSLGVPPQFGGPGVGFFATLEKNVRQMPGRLVGRAKDVDGRDGFVLALATREQHIRREKATSNICTNQGLCMTMATIYMATLGKSGLRKLAELNLSKAVYLRDKLTAIGGVEAPYSAPFFNEFVVRLPIKAAEAVAALEEKGIIAGLDLGQFNEIWENDLLVCATELTTAGAINRFAAELEAVL